MFGKIQQDKMINYKEKVFFAEDLSFGYGDGHLVLDAINFNLQVGKILSVLGPSGCGKSTLLRILAGLIEQDTGTINCLGETTKQLQENKKIGIAFQDSCLLDWLTVKENILLPTKIGLKKNDKLVNYDYKKRADYLIQLVGLDGYQNYYPSELSGGMSQRTSFARALISSPSLLLLDEPFSALDTPTKIKLMRDFSKILATEKITTVFITHNIEEAVFLSDKLIILSKKPAKILEEINIELPQPRTLNTYDVDNFEILMKQCRSLLMKN
jgi:NitT/TauT family transport system ATP-binding protein